MSFRSVVLVIALSVPGVLGVPLFAADHSIKASTRQTTTQPEIIRDRYSRTLGTIRRTSSGRLEARDRLGRLLGTYDAKTGYTRDRLGRILTQGNTLSALVMRSAEER